MKQYDLATALNSLVDVVATNDSIASALSTCSIAVEADKLTIRKWHWRLDELKEAVRSLPRTFTKRYTDDKFECIWQLAPNVEMVQYCDRDKVCKHTIVWDCEDAESILKDLDPPAEMEAGVL